MRIEIIDDTGVGGDFNARLHQQLASLGVSVTTFTPPHYERTVDVCIVFAEQLSTRHDSYLEALVAVGTPIFPVVDEERHANRIPAPIHDLVAFARARHTTTWPLALCDEVIARTWLPRRERKLFISYRRTESHAVAVQLHDELTKHGFDVFLDETSIPRSADIRGAVTRALIDVDAVVLLATPQVTASQWVLEEIAFANARGIAIIAVRWPGETLSAAGGPLAADQCLPTLTNPSMPSSKLSRRALEYVLAQVFERRALGIKSRLDQLVPLVAEWGRRRGWNLSPCAELGDLDDAVSKCFARVLPHRPSNEQLHDTRLTAEAKHSDRVTVCCYSESDPLHPSIVASRWLFEDGHVPPCELWTYTGKLR